MKQEAYKSKVYTERPAYADFDAPAKFQAIQSIVARRLLEHPKAICSYSGGADSDIMIDVIERAKDKVFSIIGADKDPATSNNAFNYQFGRWNVRCWSYLDKYLKKGTDFPWVLLDEAYNRDNSGAVWFDRTELDIRSVLAHNDANEWLGFSRWSAGFNDWRFAACGGIQGADSL